LIGELYAGDGLRRAKVMVKVAVIVGFFALSEKVRV
jgi:hypothetical protein